MMLESKVALITGAATGIGHATALRFAAAGASLVLADLNEAGGRSTVDAITASGVRAVFHACDVRDEDQVRAVVASTREQYGGLDVLVNAAGILQGAFQDVDDLELETFARVVDVNLLGTFLFCKHAARVIEAGGGGVILCIASGAGVRGPSSSLAYGASKGGVQGFCYTLEQRLRPRGIRVHVVCPGALDTPMKRQNVLDGAVAHGLDPRKALAESGLGDPDGVAKILQFLASDDADYLRGTVFTR